MEFLIGVAVFAAVVLVGTIAANIDRSRRKRRRDTESRCATRAQLAYGTKR